MKGDALSRFRADAGESAKLVDQVLDDSIVHMGYLPFETLWQWALFYKTGAEHLTHH